MHLSGICTLNLVVELEKLHEVEFVRSRNYENETACKDFISFCSKSIFDANIRDKVDHTSFIGVLCDSSTDSGVVKKGCNYILFIEPDTFKVKVTFFALKDVPLQDAQGIYSTIKSAFKDAYLEHLLFKVVLLGSNGTFVNTGMAD